jgi:S-adenosylmethionine:tRNA ribosyltransferase-isomerase
MPVVPTINHTDYQYQLPEEKIALHPLKERDQTKLLFYRKGEVSHRQFKEVQTLLPEGSILFFNNTKVIPARLYFNRSTGAQIEVFLLQPELPEKDVNMAMQVSLSCVWLCMIGNLRKWQKEEILQRHLTIGKETVLLKASLFDRDKKLVKFEWENPAIKFVDIVQAAGNIPLPPYIKRKETEEDKPRYQTVYSQKEGAVAAPTAGLHFTDQILKDLKSGGFTLDFLTLHVSAGTFQPVKDQNMVNHPMHSEQVLVNIQNIENLLSGKKVIAVGTTSMRTLESLYWYGVKLLKEGDDRFHIEKLYPWKYEVEDLPSLRQALMAVKELMLHTGKNELSGSTEIMIFPGYAFKVCKGIITNFHMPGTTLILLIAAFIGNDWRKVYQQALDNNYRFLSYGDSSLLLPDE